MFERFQDDLGTTHVSEAYREKALSLKTNLGNSNNVSLCLRVLTGEIKANALVKMTSDQLASQKAKLEREMAKEAALKETVLAPGVEDAVDNSMNCENRNPSNPPPPRAELPPSILKKSTVLSVLQKEPSVSLDAKIDEKLNDDDEDDDDDGNEIKDDENADGAPTMDSDEEELVESSHPKASSAPILERSVSSPPSTSISSSPATTYANHSYQTARSPPPPPPPSLASSFDTSAEDETSLDLDSRSNGSDRGIRIRNAFGGESFRIEIHGQVKYAFSVAFYQEDESQAIVNRYMSESLTQKGRSKIDDFNRFVSEKLRGGRWQATCLRLTTISDKDADVYRAFYKEYETKERIAMFKLYGESGSKLFLVTPKFHHIARRTRDITFANKNSTYAIVLTKKDDADIWMD